MQQKPNRKSPFTAMFTWLLIFVFSLNNLIPVPALAVNTQFNPNKSQGRNAPSPLAPLPPAGEGDDQSPAGKVRIDSTSKSRGFLKSSSSTQEQHSSQSKTSGVSVGMTVNPLSAFKDAYTASTKNSSSGSAVGKVISQGEGLANGLSAATTPVVVQAGTKKSSGTQQQDSSTARTSSLTAGKDLTILATDGSITSQGTQISAEGNALLLAKDNIVFDVAHNLENQAQKNSASGFSIDNRSPLIAGSFNNKGNGKGGSDTLTGTQLSVGGSATLATQTGDISLIAANVVAEGNLAINAANNLTIQSGQDTLSNTNQSNNKAIGQVVISDTERFAGYHNQKHSDNSTQVTQVASNVSSLNGDVTLTAGDKYTQAASNVLAGNDISITAKSIDITTAENAGSNQKTDSDLKIGAFARISSPIIDLINNVEAARKSDGRLQAMQGMAAASNAYQSASAVAGNGVLFKGEVGIGFASSSSSANNSGSTAMASTINGAGNVSLTSTAGDIHATGAVLNAGKTLGLNSAKDILLDASQSTYHADGKNKSSGVEVGVGYSVGAQTGVYAYVAANVGSGHNQADGVTNSNTHLTGNAISISSKGDTILKGADAKANTITADVAGKLTIASVQDKSAEDSKQTNVGGRVQVSFGTAWDASGSVSQSKGSGSSTAVNQQSGLFAADGGYHVKADAVDLKGGAIVSSNAQNSDLTTNTLTSSNLENKMNYAASSVSLAGGISGGSGAGDTNADGTKKPVEQQQLFGDKKSGNVTPGLPMLDKGGASSTTYATVSDGNITIGGKTTASVKDLGINTDAAKAHTSIAAIPDIKVLLKDQQAMSAAAGTVIATSKQIAGDIAAHAGKALDAAQKVINDPNSSADQIAQAKLSLIDAKQTQTDWGTGGDNSRALAVVTGILVGGVAGQGATQLAANASAPYAAADIGDYFKTPGNENQTLQDLSHAILGATLAYANGTSAAGGALAGGGAELAAQVLTKQLYPDAFDANGQLIRDKLTAAQANNITALSSGIGALLSGVAGGSVLDAAVGGKIATNAVENNFLKHADASAMKKEFDQCSKKSGGCSDADYVKIRDKYLAVSRTNIAQVESCILSGNVKCVSDLEGQAASRGEISTQLVGADYNIVTGKQDNVNLYASVKGTASLFGSDVQQAQDIATFRQSNCSGVSASACDGMVKDALTDRLARVGILTAVGLTTAVAVNGVRTLRLPGKTGLTAAEDAAAVRNGTQGAATVEIPPPGNVKVLPGAIPDANELRASQGLADLGYDVSHQPTASSQNIQNQRTADLSVKGVGQVDVYTPENLAPANITKAIEKKANQATGVLVQANLSDVDMASIAARTWGKPTAQNIQTLFFQKSDGTILIFTRPPGGK